jgi:uncharacterized membrane protein YkvA (DUF1232 family)
METAHVPGLLFKAIAYFRDPSVALWKKLIGVAAVLYAVWPLDVIPDVPVIGWLDDLGVLSLATWYMVREIKRHQVVPPAS